MAQLTKETFKIIDEYLEDIIDYKWMGRKSRLILLGGLILNIDGERPFFVPMKFEARLKSGKKLNLLQKGKSSPLHYSKKERGIPSNKYGKQVKVSKFKKAMESLPDAQRIALFNNFESALPGAVYAEKATEAIKKIGLTNENTLFAASLCPDELNHDNIS